MRIAGWLERIHGHPAMLPIPPLDIPSRGLIHCRRQLQAYCQIHYRRQGIRTVLSLKQDGAPLGTILIGVILWAIVIINNRKAIEIILGSHVDFGTIVWVKTTDFNDNRIDVYFWSLD